MAEPLIDSILARLANVEKNHIDRLELHLPQRSAGVFRSVNLESHAAGNFLGQIPYPAVCIHNQQK